MRLIDADALIEDIKSFWDWDSIDGITATTVLKQTMTDISDAPTIDAVPVVRCKECKFAHITIGGECKYCDEWDGDEALYLDGDFFCAFGKWRDEDDETD